VDREWIAKQHEIKQHSQLIVNELPGFLWRLYSRLIDEGFEEDQSLELVKVYLGNMVDSGGQD
jgi:hypothetical protein